MADLIWDRETGYYKGPPDPKWADMYAQIFVPEVFNENGTMRHVRIAVYYQGHLYHTNLRLPQPELDRFFSQILDEMVDQMDRYLNGITTPE